MNRTTSTTRTFGTLEALENRTFKSVTPLGPETTPADVSDANGDGIVTDLDVTFQLKLENKAGDADLNGVVDQDDYNAFLGGANGEKASWFSGDFNADGVVDNKDESIILGQLFKKGDADINGVVDADDYSMFMDGLNGYAAPSWYSGDFNADGIVDNRDQSILLGSMFKTGDADCNGVVDADDYSVLLDGMNGYAAPSWFSGDFNADGKVDNRDQSILLGQLYKAGDANCDGVVDGDDFSAFQDGRNGSTEISWFNGDFNGDGQINDVDGQILLGNLG